MAGEMGVTEIAASSQALISSIVQDVLKAKAQLLPTVMDYSSMVGPGDKSVAINKRTQFTQETKAENTDFTKQVLTFSADTIALTDHEGTYAVLEDIAKFQSKPNVVAEIASEMAAELAKDIDDKILVQLKLASSSAPDHILDYIDTAGDVIALGDIANARYLLNVQNVPFEDRWLIASPKKESELLQIDNFRNANLYGSREALLNGEIGSIYGFRVLVHPSLADDDTLFYHKSHVGFARQMEPTFESDRHLASASTEFLMQNLYGSKVLDSGLRGVYYSGV